MTKSIEKPGLLGFCCQKLNNEQITGGVFDYACAVI
jgi:hypothetical protein